MAMSVRPCVVSAVRGEHLSNCSKPLAAVQELIPAMCWWACTALRNADEFISEYSVALLDRLCAPRSVGEASLLSTTVHAYFSRCVEPSAAGCRAVLKC